MKARIHLTRLLTAIACLVLGGCAAITNPVANGVPVRLLPDELLAGGPPREEMVTIPLTMLGQTPPKVYRLAPHDVLGVYIETVLPASTDPGLDPPVYFPSQIDPLAQGLPATLGYPIPVEDNGAIDLPVVGQIEVAGKTVAEAKAAIRQAYFDRQILQAGTERIIVNLMQQRQTRVKVVRQESGGFTSGGLGGIVAASEKRGTAFVVNLRAYENDVLSALTATGGLPGLDAYDEVIVFKGSGEEFGSAENIDPNELVLTCPRVIRIPTRILPGEPPPFTPEDVILDEGDVVFLEARAVELFYTGGLLPSGEHELPRDYDLDVVEAVALVQGSLINGAFGGNNLSGGLIQPRFGNPNPSLLTLVRRTPNGRQAVIRVDLNRALRDDRERLRVQAGDLLILQETPQEAIARYISQTFNFITISRVLKTGSTTGDAVFAPAERVILQTGGQ